MVEAVHGLKKAFGNDHAAYRAGLRDLVNLYEAWNAVEPGGGYDAKAAEWRAEGAGQPPAHTERERQALRHPP